MHARFLTICDLAGLLLILGLLLVSCGGPGPASRSTYPVTIYTFTATPPSRLTGTPTATPIRPLAVTPSVPSPATTLTVATLNLPALQQAVFRLINQDRQAASVTPVIWDEVAARAGQAHAEEMLAANYMSHWNQQGYGPDHRYAFVGGLDAVFENVHSSYYRYSDGRGVPVTDWEAKLAEVEKDLVNSPGHRKQIIDPAHTHVGVGIAYNPVNGEFRLVQEFVNRYAQIELTPPRASPGAAIPFTGKLLQKGPAPVLVSVAYEPFPKPMTVTQLNATSTYTMVGGAASGEVGQRPEMSGEKIKAILTVGSKPGLYHLRLWVTVNGQQAMAVDRIVEVR